MRGFRDVKPLRDTKEKFSSKNRNNEVDDLPDEISFDNNGKVVDAKKMKSEVDDLPDEIGESVNDIKLEIFESYEANLITESEKKELLNMLENTAYNKRHKLDVDPYPNNDDIDIRTNSKEEGKHIAKQKAFNKEVGIKDDKFIDMDIDEARYLKDKQRRKIDRAVEANKLKKSHDKLQKELNDPKKRGKYNVVLTGNGATLVDPREEKKKELLKRIADKKKNQ